MSVLTLRQHNRQLVRVFVPDKALFFAITYHLDGSWFLVSFDEEFGSLNTVAELPVPLVSGVGSLALGPDCEMLYTIGDGQLYQISQEDGRISILGAAQTSGDGVAGLSYDSAGRRWLGVDWTEGTGRVFALYEDLALTELGVGRIGRELRSAAIIPQDFDM